MILPVTLFDFTPKIVYFSRYSLYCWKYMSILGQLDFLHCIKVVYSNYLITEVVEQMVFLVKFLAFISKFYHISLGLRLSILLNLSFLSIKFYRRAVRIYKTHNPTDTYSAGSALPGNQTTPQIEKWKQAPMGVFYSLTGPDI